MTGGSGVDVDAGAELFVAAQEAADSAQQVARTQEIDTRGRDLQRRREAVEAQVAALWREFEAEADAVQRLGTDAVAGESGRADLRAVMGPAPLGAHLGGGRKRHAAAESRRRTAGRPPMTEPDASMAGAATGEPPAQWDLRLYVAGQTPKSLRAIDNLQHFCEQYLPGRYHIEVIDLIERPQLARGDEILALPTLVRNLPEPMRKIIGDLSDTSQVLVGLQLRERAET